MWKGRHVVTALFAGTPSLGLSDGISWRRRFWHWIGKTLLRGLALKPWLGAEPQEEIIGEPAFKVQIEAPKVLDLSHETQQTFNLYGIGKGELDRAVTMKGPQKS